MDWIVLETSLAAFDRGELDVNGLCRRWREGARDMSALPPRYATVLDDVLGRMESGALFTEESCSFSVKDLRDTLEVWLQKARALQS